MQKRAENEVFGHFNEFGWFNWSDTAYNDSTKCFNMMQWLQVLSKSSEVETNGPLGHATVLEIDFSSGNGNVFLYTS